MGNHCHNFCRYFIKKTLSLWTKLHYQNVSKHAIILNGLYINSSIRLRNDLYCVEWGVKLYSLTHSLINSSNRIHYDYYYHFMNDVSDVVQCHDTTLSMLEYDMVKDVVCFPIR